MKPNFNIYFLTLPENLDPDSYINQKGKESFLKLVESKIEIPNFIWDSYYKRLIKITLILLHYLKKKLRHYVMM